MVTGKWLNGQRAKWLKVRVAKYQALCGWSFLAIAAEIGQTAQMMT
jgi:hypothetical protein